MTSFRLRVQVLSRYIIRRLSVKTERRSCFKSRGQSHAKKNRSEGDCISTAGKITLLRNARGGF
jgi:hypothetical protein